MAVAAELLEQQTPQPFDWHTAEAQLVTETYNWQTAEIQFAEEQFPDSVDEHPPESEIYGRSLSTIRRLGAFMLGKALNEIVDSPEAAQAKVEFYTSVEEGFGTDMELGGGLEVRDFDSRPVFNGQVIAKDLKTPISAMTNNGLKKARRQVKEDPRFQPQLDRSYWDHENALAVDAMASGETSYNTRIVVSPFPEEGVAKSGAAYWRRIGYVPHLRRGFVQLYHVSKTGEEVLSGSLSFDGCSKHRLRKVFESFDKEIPEDEVTDNWLKYAITGNMSTEEAKELARTIADESADPAYKKNTNTVDITRQYKPYMERVFNESYVHICESLVRGQQTDGTQQLVLQLADNAHHYNDRYSSALYKMRSDSEQFTDDDSIVLHELLVYSTIEMMRALHLNKIDAQSRTSSVPQSYDKLNPDLLHLQAADASQFQNALGGFGAEGAKNNRAVSACGIEIAPGGDKQNGGPQTAYGGTAESPQTEETSTKKMMTCPYCSAKVYDDPCAAILKCWDCAATVVNGRVISQGNGGSKARAAAKKEAEAARKVEREKAHEAAMAKRVAEVFEGSGMAFPEAKESPEQLDAMISKPMGQLAVAAV